MKFKDLKPDFILDMDTETEVIHIHLNHEHIPNGLFYSKNRYLKHSFQGKEIMSSDDYIRTKAIWYFDFTKQKKIEVVPFGDFDINQVDIMGNYLYYTKITDKDNDGLLTNDYCHGEIHRINLISFEAHYCCDIHPYNFHGFEVATEKYIVFLSEDQILDTSEIVFIDIENRKKAVVSDSWKDGLDYKFIFNEEKKTNVCSCKKICR